MLAMSEDPVLHGPVSTVEATYPFMNQPPILGSLVPFLRICCEELDRYCIWPVCHCHLFLFPFSWSMAMFVG